MAQSDDKKPRVILEAGTRRSVGNFTPDGPMTRGRLLAMMEASRRRRHTRGKSLRERLDELMG